MTPQLLWPGMPQICPMSYTAQLLPLCPHVFGTLLQRWTQSDVRRPGDCQAGSGGGDRILTLLFSPSKVIPAAYKEKEKGAETIRLESVSGQQHEVARGNQHLPGMVAPSSAGDSTQHGAHQH